MALPARLTAALGRHPDDLTEDDLQRTVDSRIPESVDLDWKKLLSGTIALLRVGPRSPGRVPLETVLVVPSVPCRV